MTMEECLIQPRTPKPVPDIPNDVLRQFDMSGKVCIVTGASRGIGYAVAEGFAEAGASVVMVYRTQRPYLEETTAALAEHHNVKIVHRWCDISNAKLVEALIAVVKKEFGRIDVFVANAGICIPGSMFEQSLEEYHSQWNTNVHGVYYCAKSVGLVFKEQGFGNFIITSSISGQVVTVPEDHTTYNATKAAVAHLGRSLAREWRGFARVNMVSPGWIDTDMSSDEASINEACRMAVLGRLGKRNGIVLRFRADFERRCQRDEGCILVSRQLG